MEPTSWAVSPYSWEAAVSLSRDLGLPLIAAMVLAGRGLADAGEARTFLDSSVLLPDPFLFGVMEEAVAILLDAVDRGRRVVVHGDYDADGVTATALMVLGLRDFGLEAEWYLPSRFKEGYGLSRTAVETIAAQGGEVLITVDCGVNYPEEVALAKEAGLDVLVVDHHQPGPVLPACPVIHSAVGTYPHGELCGVGLALKVMHALHIRRRSAQRDVLPEALHGLLDLVAVGTIADLAALRGENRFYVREGLKLIGIGSRVGLRALARVAGCTGAVDSGAVAFRLAPRLNAAGRLADPSGPLRLLLTEDEAEAEETAAHLHELNCARQDVERGILEEAVARVESLPELPAAIVLGGEGWHEGVVGIVASRLVERYNRPSILLGIRDGVAKGSGRSISGYDLMAALNACAQHLTVYGGHKQAVGLTLEAGAVEGFREAVEKHAAETLGARDLRPTYRADAVLRGEDLNADTATALASLGPFGSGNPRPRLLLVEAGIRRPETTRTGDHLRCQVEVDGIVTRAIGFGLGDMAATLRADGVGRILGAQLVADEWRGALRSQLILERIGAAGEGGVAPDGVQPDGVVLCDCGPVCPEWSSGGVESDAGLSRRPSARGASLPHLPETRDLRDKEGEAAAMAQVIAGGEPTAILTCSLPHVQRGPLGRIPLEEMSRGSIACVGSTNCGRSKERAGEATLLLTEWDAAIRSPDLLQGRIHVIAVDPPYRSEHVRLLRRLDDDEVLVHLHYGADERRMTATLLRYLVHPRFAMVCVYRAMREGVTDGDGLLQKAAERGRREVGVVLGRDELQRAYAILRELGIDGSDRQGGRARPGEAKLEAKCVAAYVAAEAVYEECSRLCQNL